MRKWFACALIIAALLIAPPSLAETAVFSVTIPTGASGAVLMDENGASLCTLIGSQTANGQTVWTFQVTNNGADTAYLYTKDANGDWLHTGISYPMDWIFPGTSGDQGGSVTPTPSSAWPVREYKLHSVSAIPLAEEQRVQSRCGPGKTYHGAGGYKPYKMTSTDALFIEGSYMLVDMNYTTVGHRRVYFPVSAFSDVRAVPAETLSGVAAETTADMVPTFGPGLDYDTFDEAVIPSGTAVSVYFEENGWVFAEFACALGPVRAWLPADQVMAE